MWNIIQLRVLDELIEFSRCVIDQKMIALINVSLVYPFAVSLAEVMILVMEQGTVLGDGTHQRLHGDVKLKLILRHHPLIHFVLRLIHIVLQV